mmetsp:Transcript_14845/g.28303  ORF Transcript_14845/g.28303 Transcript_14845/m.28303 type:complete len:82 (+) Transcript_14845:15-260(+)
MIILLNYTAKLERLVKATSGTGRTMHRCLRDTIIGDDSLLMKTGCARSSGLAREKKGCRGSKRNSQAFPPNPPRPAPPAPP